MGIQTSGWNELSQYKSSSPNSAPRLHRFDSIFLFQPQVVVFNSKRQTWPATSTESALFIFLELDALKAPQGIFHATAGGPVWWDLKGAQEPINALTVRSLRLVCAIPGRHLVDATLPSTGFAVLFLSI